MPCKLGINHQLIRILIICMHYLALNKAYILRLKLHTCLYTVGEWIEPISLTLGTHAQGSYGTCHVSVSVSVSHQGCDYICARILCTVLYLIIEQISMSMKTYKWARHIRWTALVILKCTWKANGEWTSHSYYLWAASMNVKALFAYLGLHHYNL